MWSMTITDTRSYLTFGMAAIWLMLLAISSPKTMDTTTDPKRAFISYAGFRFYVIALHNISIPTNPIQKRLDLVWQSESDIIFP